MTHADSDADRLRAFWDSRYQDFSLSESGWLGAGARLNEYLYRAKFAALRAALRAAGASAESVFSVLDAGCGQGYFADFYRRAYPRARYVGIDISDRLVAHLRRTVPGGEFHTADLADFRDAAGRTFDVVQSFEVVHLLLDDAHLARAVDRLAGALAPRGVLLITAALPDATVQPTPYTKFRSREVWNRLLAARNLRIAEERPMYFWLPAGGPQNRYLRFAFDRLGAAAVYAADRAALALGAPRSASAPLDSRMRLLTITRTA